MLTDHLLTLAVDEIQFVKELYPRLREDDAAIERYRAAIDRLPPITVARGRVLVDGFHRWQAHRREGAESVQAEDLGNLTDAEILRESIRRNASHGQQLKAKEKHGLAGRLWRDLAHLSTGDRERELMGLLSVSERAIRDWTRDARAAEIAEQHALAWDLWLDCYTQEEIAAEVGVTQPTISGWLIKFGKSAEFYKPPVTRQHFDIWEFATADDDAGTPSFFGKVPPQVIENLLWLYTEPGQIVVDPFAGGGTVIDVAKRMGRRVWASDLSPTNPLLPIHAHDITTGWPRGAPDAALIFLDPPYWQQAAGRYSDDPRDLGNMCLADFAEAWAATLDACVPHLAAGGRLAFIISPSVDGERVRDHAMDLLLVAWQRGLQTLRRIIVPYTTQQATGQQVNWAKDNRQLLKRYRDLVILERPA
jgi:hypothetical protein